MIRLPLVLLAAAGLAGSAAAELPVMPLPAEAVARAAELRIPAQWGAEITGADQARVRAAVERMRTRWAARSGADWRRDVGQPVVLSISADRAAPAWPALGEDESYSLDIGPNRAVLRAPTGTGVLRGLATLEQLLQSDRAGWFLPEASIQDRPRFAWRGLMIDVSRHWMPLEVIERNLDAMALVKLNVLHWHLSDDQGFRVASRAFPRLTEFGSDGRFYTQAQVREVVAYAAARGIRVVPEFDLPGHSLSWLVGYPEYASGPGPFSIRRSWRIEDMAIDPTNPAVYGFLDRFVAEMTGLFPDAYFHIGGDEVNGKSWNANPRIQAFIRSHGLAGNAGLQTYFNGRLLAIVTAHGRRMVGWDEIFHPGLPKDTVIESWRGPKSLDETSRAGYGGILAYGYYLDHLRPAGVYYANDPLPHNSGLSPEEEHRIMGGEAAMWGEFVSPETVDSRIWPAAAAVAERLWSPVTVTDQADMYRRLALVSHRLEESGARHESYRGEMLRRLAGDAATPDELAALVREVDILEAAGLHQRLLADPTLDQLSPLTGLPDCARPESETARDFGLAVDRLLAEAPDARAGDIAVLRRRLSGWRADALSVAGPLADHSPRIAQVRTVFETTARVCQAGLGALDALGSAADRAAAPTDHLDLGENSPVRIAISPGVRHLVAAAQKTAGH